MPIDEERHGPVVVLTPSGGMDLTTLPAFDGRVQALLDEGVAAILWDLSRAQVLPSVAIGFLLQAARRLHATGGHMALCGVGRLARSTLRTMGVLDVFPIHETRAGGLAELGARLRGD